MNAAPRLASLDAFRGFAIAAMMLVNNPGDWGHIYAPLAHAEWNGWTFTDMVFPFFLFAAGVAMPISIERRRALGTPPGRLVAELSRRALVIFGVGLALNFIPAFDLSTLRIPGVLQRIALCVLAAAPIVVLGSMRTLLAAPFVLLAVYTIAMLAIPVPGPDGVVAAGLLEPGRDFGAWVDRSVLDGHLWAKSRTWDPEGLVSTLPAIASLLFGVIAGRGLLLAPTGLATSGVLFVGGLVMLGAGFVLDRALMPINKNLWTTSYCIFMTGWSQVLFAGFHALLDGDDRSRNERARRWLKPLEIMGMNALFLFALAGLIGRLLGAIHVGSGAGTSPSLKAWLYGPLQALAIAPENASLLFALGFEAVMFAVAWAMWRKRWFVKA